MAENWKIYTLDLDGAPATCLIDIEQIESAPDESRPVCHLLRVPFKDGGEAGYGDQGERDALAEREEQVFADVNRKTGAVLVASVRGGGQIDHWLYSSKKQSELVGKLLGEAFPGYEVEVAANEDPEWEHYLDQLLPDEEGWQEIGNGDVVAAMAESGDPLVVPRPVEHLAYFKEEADARVFASAMETEGFEVTGIELGDEGMEENEGDGAPWLVDFKRVEPVTLEEINAVTGWLVGKAREHGGGYDGWQAEVRDSEGRGPEEME